MAVDPCFGADSYGRPATLSESKTIVYNILTILLGKPGCFPSSPGIGMNIQQYLYGFADEIDTDVIKAMLAKQSTDLIEFITGEEFEIYQDEYQGNVMLVFHMTVNVSETKREIVLGLTTNTAGSLLFNYEFVDNQVI